jgi:hydroxymethylpyrimidine/phosphomethylpyrimidine kinase
MDGQAIPVALTIAGSDSGGGAGIQADLKTFHQFGVFGTSVVTAVTAQNTVGVQKIHTVPMDDVRAQLDAVSTDLRSAAFKTGMLGSAALIRCVAAGIREHALLNYVMDPVMVATSGDRLLEEDAVAQLIEELLPLATLVTPNLHEAEILTGTPVTTLSDMRRAAHSLVEDGVNAALIKGGHLEGDAVDLLWDGHREQIWRRPRLATDQTHGTGCTLSAAITAGLAHGSELYAAVDRAVGFVHRAIATAPGLGKGHGPVNHFVPTD